MYSNEVIKQEKKPLWRFGTKEVVYAAIGAALYAVVTWAFNVWQIPGAGNVGVRPAVVIPMFFGIAFGPIVGFITGFVGMLFGMSFLTTVLYSAVGLVVFMLLTAYDTQKLSQMFSYYAYDGELAEKASIYGALTLYLDFINIFLYVVRLLGMNSRRRN